MKLTLNRKFKGQTYTIGDLSIDGKFFCNTIEDAVRELPATCPDTPRGRFLYLQGKGLCQDCHSCRDL